MIIVFLLKEGKNSLLIVEKGGTVKEMRELVKKLEKYCKLFGIVNELKIILCY